MLRFGGQEAWNQRRGKNTAHGGKFQHEDAGGQRGTKEARKDGTHAAHGQHRPLVPVQLQQLAQAGTHGAAQLQGCALTAGRTAEEVGDSGDDMFFLSTQPQFHLLQDIQVQSYCYNLNLLLYILLFHFH